MQSIIVQPPLSPPQAMLEEQISAVQENEVVRLRMVQMSAIPDTLYMVDDKAYHHAHHHHPLPPLRHTPHHHHHQPHPSTSPTVDSTGTILGKFSALPRVTTRWHPITVSGLRSTVHLRGILGKIQISRLGGGRGGELEDGSPNMGKPVAIEERALIG